MSFSGKAFFLQNKPDSPLITATQLCNGLSQLFDGTYPKEQTDVRVKVADETDSALVFGEIESGEVEELSPAGTFVMKVRATDADKPQNHASEIVYTIIKQNPPDDLFYINRKNGSIYVKKPLLDREKCDRYILTIKGEDLNGPPERKTATSTVTINVLDVNDNSPTLEKHQYEGSIEENTQGVEVLKIKAEDLDLKGTDNWAAVFDIVRGNEAGYFSITTDPNTNEGILMLDKSVDYEDVKNIELGLAVRNRSPPFYRSVGAKYHLIKISVKNQREGPHFFPRVKVIPISEEGTSFNITEVIALYPAIDVDTGKAAENVSYAKNSDRDNWLTIDPETAEIKLNKIPDRESPHVVDGIYFAKILCIREDTPPKTATGTIAIQVEDFNDNCPILTSDNHTICTTENAVIVNADDKDSYQNGPPFKFEIILEGTEGKWRIEHLTNTSAILRAQQYLWPDVYEVKLMVKDQMGYACPEPQEVLVQVCTCEDEVVCGVHIGPTVIRILVRGPVLVLLRKCSMMI
ncbi:desmoglein-2-like [Archocentrus centrarchus]|uniref:desmoglein-2-like n=1 Tax=Archocentrus centrarchus TaxID=63155 RepID=UPI0011EA252D|nr:desmoglein-2-like [Archocentrus centrarchus]